MKRISIGFKVGAVLALFAVLASGLTGYYAYSTSRTLLLDAAERDLLTATQVLGRRLVIIADKVARDARVMAAVPATHQVFDDEHPELQRPATERVAGVFATLLRENPEFLQLRLIDADHYGLERVRVDRDGQRAVRVADSELQEKGHFPYVFETLKRPEGQVYLSPVSVNRERGAHTGFGKPTLHVGAPVVDGGRAVGAVVINLDLNGLFSLMAEDLPEDYRLYLTNADGDFLIHPDGSKTFGFEHGRRVLAQDSFPGVARLVSGESDVAMENLGKEGMVATFISLPFTGVDENQRLILGLSQPEEAILAKTTLLGQTVVRFVVGFSAAAFVLALLLARAMTMPLKLMVKAAGRFAEQRKLSQLPLQRRDELGELAHSLHLMQGQILSYLDNIEAQRQQLEYQTRHDPLTGLANRRLFFEAVDQAIARARRSGKRIALLFIDLDRFKAINDNFGHAVGDELLVEVARKLVATVREVDLVARLAGDEFVIMVENVDSHDSVKRIVDALHHQFSNPCSLPGDQSVALTISVGVSLYPDNGSAANELLHNADQAMYQAKNSGGNSDQFSAVTAESSSSDEV